VTDPFTAAVVCAYLFAGDVDPLCYELLQWSENSFVDEATLGKLFHSQVNIDTFPDIPVTELPDVRVLRSTYTLGRRMDYF